MIKKRVSKSCLRWLRGRIATVTSVAIASTLVGCTMLTSELPSQLAADGRAPEGVHYFLPKAIVELELAYVRPAASFMVTSTPKYVPDAKHRYYMQYRPLPNYSDNFKIELNASHTFLKKVEVVKAEDQTIAIIENLAQLAGVAGRGLEAAEGGAGGAIETVTTLTADPGDPDDLARVARHLNEQVRKIASLEAKNFCAGDALDQKAGIIVDTAQRARCEAYRTIARSQDHVRIAVHRAQGYGRQCDWPNPSSQPTRPPPARAINVQPADCTSGLCYRPALPYELCAKVGKVVSRTLFEMPNLSRAVEIDIQRALLVNKKQTVEFDEESGLLTTLKVSKGSELLALSSIPLVVVNALLDGIQLRINITNNLQQAATAETGLLQKRAELVAAKAQLEAAVARSNPPGASARGFPVAAPARATQSSTLFDRNKPID